MRQIIDRMESIPNPPEIIRQKLLELANELAFVSGKKQYGYLKKPLKELVDSIVDELEKLPEVAAYYAAWNGLRDTLEGYYKSCPGSIIHSRIKKSSVQSRTRSSRKRNV